MSRRTIWIIVSGVLAAIVIAGGVVWYQAQAYDDLVADCRQALAARADTPEVEGKPTACQGVEKDDYRGLVLEGIFDNMSPEGRDTVDWLTDD
ncbi:hypothetical protein [Streptomyces sp. N35]|uniref:hypothetical protein n=1 Tax=Streptomyces sp. N35 TaxID=2795730 RepID=UPI0018F5A0CA|nr:hypothetical protein [Streptomyces sp. N35]